MKLHYLVVSVFFILGACAVDPIEIKVAEKTCVEHGGLRFLYAFPTTEVHCKDGFVAKNLRAGTKEPNIGY